jgi:hypothetical protein
MGHARHCITTLNDLGSHQRAEPTFYKDSVAER